jgi:hypothetical protein
VQVSDLLLPTNAASMAIGRLYADKIYLFYL